MRRDAPVRAAIAVLAATLVLSGCAGEGSSEEPADPASPSVTSPATSGSTPTGGATGLSPRPSAEPPPAEVDLSVGRLTVRAPRDGWIRLRGAYPYEPSRCVGADPPTFDARYPGAMTLRRTGDGSITASVTVPFQRYLEGIAEVPPTWPRAALEAQVIAARTYVLSRTGWSGEAGETLDPICGTASCQVYGGIPHPRPPGLSRWYRAVRETRGQVLLAGGAPADTLYFSTSNGRTYGNDEVFGGSPLPYLRPVVERDDGASPLSRWRVELPVRDLEVVLHASGAWPGGVRLADATARGGAVTLSGGGQRRTIGASELRDAVNTWAACLLPRRYPTGGLPVAIPSGWFSVSTGPRGLVVTGRGWGHGVGMVQWGAYGKAGDGWSAARILAFYYGGLRPTPLAEPETVQVVVATGLRSATLKPSGPGARLGDRTLGPGALQVRGGDELTVSGGA